MNYTTSQDFYSYFQETALLYSPVFGSLKANSYTDYI